MFSEEGWNAEEAVFVLRKEVQVIVDSVRLERSEGLLGFIGAQKIGVEVKEMLKGGGFTDCPIESNCIWVRTGVVVPLHLCWERDHGIGGGKKTGETEIGWRKVANDHVDIEKGVFVVCVDFAVQNAMVGKGLLGQILDCGESIT